MIKFKNVEVVEINKITEKYSEFLENFSVLIFNTSIFSEEEKYDIYHEWVKKLETKESKEKANLEIKINL